MRAAVSFAVAALILRSAAAFAEPSKTYTGIVTDTMCRGDHAAMMHVQPDSKCVLECVKYPANKVALFDGKSLYVLSDQTNPLRFAGQKVKVTGTVDVKTNLLKVERIEKVN